MPEAPTSVPATISRSLSSTKPDAATASPVKEFSSEISTGTSAPPMGSTKMTPSTSDSPRMIQTNAMFPVTSARMIITAMATPTSALMTCWPGYVIGRPVISSWSLTKATALPEKDTDPMSTPRSTSAVT